MSGSNTVNIYNDFGRCRRAVYSGCGTAGILAYCAAAADDAGAATCHSPSPCAAPAADTPCDGVVVDDDACATHTDACDECTSDVHECDDTYDDQCDDACAAFSKRMIIASGDLTDTRAPWDRVDDDDCEAGLARKLFRAAMHERGLVENCDYQFVSADYADVWSAADDTAGPLMQSGYVDAFLGAAPTAARRRNALFGVPFHATNADGSFGVGLTVNKKSPCAKKLIKTFNAGLKRIICNGVYANCVLKGGDDSFEHWCEYPTVDSHPELMALIDVESHCLCRPRRTSGATCSECTFNHTLLIAAGDPATATAPWHSRASCSAP
jgi:hypothetical protein